MSAVPITHDDAKVLDWPLQHNDGVVKVHSTSDRWEVKVVGDQLVVHFLHEERTDEHGTVKREINRSYHLPSDIDTSTLKSHLTGRGVLQITAQKKK